MCSKSDRPMLGLVGQSPVLAPKGPFVWANGEVSWDRPQNREFFVRPDELRELLTTLEKFGAPVCLDADPLADSQ
jgi:hypothetical protein